MRTYSGKSSLDMTAFVQNTILSSHYQPQRTRYTPDNNDLTILDTNA